jgi:hypothetical protein
LPAEQAMSSFLTQLHRSATNAELLRQIAR